jgi:hypothetical protein
LPQPEVSKGHIVRHFQFDDRERSAAPASKSPAFWERRFYDFNVWIEKKLREKLNYMHRNPVERKLIRHPQDQPWSGWSFYKKGENGLIRMVYSPEGADNSFPLDHYL